MRYIPGAAVPLNQRVVTAATSANAQPLNTATVETYTGTLAVGATGSTVSLILNGVTYKQEFSTDAATTAGLLATACGSGTYDKWSFTVSNTASTAQTWTVTIPGDPLSPFSIAIANGDSAATAAGKIRTGLAGATVYTVSGGGSAFSLTKAARGAGVTVSASSSGNQTATTTHSIVGVAGQTAWNVSAVGAALTIAHATAGATADTATSAVTGTFTLTLTESIVGKNALLAGSGVSLFGVMAANGTAVALLNAGTSYDLQLWNRFDGIGWKQDATFGTKTVNASNAYLFTVQGIETYAYVSNFVGGGSATVTITTPS